ncbi:hypothetical protein FZEAL_3828 [Fusarium zealandicum]|uniref:Uncharacterized protein n=1 Tax=Fusarium zealandicum TaxID=1053134 RepID=A0A8H4UMY7_9HYPO|nr:hypothetical protein FZEAL_3828 [Fusarium zealandicum]
MAVRYTADHLLHLRDSPLCIKPPNLPPTEEWMGPAPEPNRTQNKTAGDRPRSNDNPLLDQTNRRPGAERHVSRNSASRFPLGYPEDLVFAPPRMAFASARGNKSLENDKPAKEAEPPARFGNFRSRNGDLDSDRFREGRNSNGLRRREAGDGESDGWSTVKPRKSFGHEGAERFAGRMGGNFREEKRQPKERDDREATRDRPARTFDTFTRDRDGDDNEGRARNGMNRNKSEPWYKNEPNTAVTPNTNETTTPDKRERIDRAKSWRDRDAAAAAEASDDRHNSRTHDRRWGRDQRVEREPEWLDEPLEEQPEAHTQQDFQKWMEEMKKAKAGIPSAPSKPAAVEVAAAIIEAEKPPVQSAPAVETGPDKFFMAFAGNAGLDSPGTNEVKEPANKPKAAGKSSRFTSFFSQPQEEIRGKTEPPTPMTGPPINGGGAPPMPMFGGPAPGPDDERQAFQQLLAKLQKQTMSATPPGPSPFAAPQGTPPNAGRPHNVASPGSPFQQYGGDRGLPMGRPPPQHVQEILAPRPQQQSARPEQLLQDLVGQRQHAPSQGSGRPDAARNNSNTEFLMNLMRAPPDAQRNELLMRMGGLQQQKQGPMPPLNGREPDFPRDDRGPQRQMRPQPPPGFPMDERFHNPPDADSRPNQPTQILQRPPPPPGLDQMPPSWMPGGGQMPPPQQRGPMIPPPGLAGGLVGPGPNRNMPMHHMFPPNFPPGAMPPPEAMGGMPPRNMPPPPPGFFGGPPHGFIPPGLGGFNGPPGPDFPGGPFEARGMPPAGNTGRGAAYGRP